MSALVKNPTREFRHYLDWSVKSHRTFVPSFSLFTVLELRRSPSVYEQFIEHFSMLPCVFLKSFDLLIEDEVRSYPDPSGIDPCLVAFAGPLSEAQLAETLDAYFQSDEGVQAEKKWNDARADVVDGIRSLVSNFPPDGHAYTPNEVRRFIEVAGFSQLAMRQFAFAQRMLERGEVVAIDAFPSVKAATFTVFYKFYVDEKRRPSDSDAFDILISAAAPYVEAIVTENHQAEVLRKTKRRDDFVKNLRVFTLSDFRQAIPA